MLLLAAIMIKVIRENRKANPVNTNEPLFLKSLLFHRCTIADTPNIVPGGLLFFSTTVTSGALGPIGVVPGLLFSTSAFGGAVGTVGGKFPASCFGVSSSRFDMVFLEFDECLRIQSSIYKRT